MKLLSVSAVALFSLLAPVSASAGNLAKRDLPFYTFSQTPLKIQDQTPVKGDNPLVYCSGPETNSLQIDSVDLTPNPPKAGQTLTIKASGTLREEVKEGAYALLEVKYGLITLIRQTVSLCDEIKNVDLECPLKEGHMTLTKQVELPSQIPPGKYNVHADVHNADDSQITCLDAHDIEFKFGGL